MRSLSATERDMVRLVADPGFGRWLEQIRNVGGCAHPIYLAGHTTVRDGESGEVLRHFDTAGEPGGRLAVRCRNRRETRCGPCSRLHAGDTFHLVRSGLSGGKGTPAVVRDHPRLFVTLTAPSFGQVHHLTDEGKPCLPRRDGGMCEHGRSVGCRLVHMAGDPLLGQPLCPGCYDYAGHVLWHAHAGALWNRFCDRVRRTLATSVGIAQSRLRHHVRLSFAKVAEYQQRAAVHFHAVVRLDGPTGPDAPPPDWATVEQLESAIRAAADTAAVLVPYSSALGEQSVRWGTELDVSPIRSFGDDAPVTDDRVAAYVAKYVGKSVAEAGGSDRRLASAAEIPYAGVNAHIRALMGMCWRLGGLRELEGLRLRAWAHTLGYRGHVLTKSRAYSTTYAALRAARADHLRGAPDEELHDLNDGIVTDSTWRYVGSGLSLAESEIAAGIAEDQAQLREIAREIRDGRAND
ncbi:replication initiator [Streptomyces sp. ISID311]|uniref:replication initiator n=1 Tax=Streptomyces sp. ISID311 TaxID=2601673 RepID=UPI0011BD3F79|nr:replication initiator [Streptomyces sp. ISID311]TXC95490.1 plasmid replication initiator protein [Streptomyces sp. ISID311]